MQQLVGRRAAMSSSPRDVLRPSGHIVYDAHEAVVCFLSDEVDGCVDEFRGERVQDCGHHVRRYVCLSLPGLG